MFKECTCLFFGPDFKCTSAGCFLIFSLWLVGKARHALFQSHCRRFTGETGDDDVFKEVSQRNQTRCFAPCQRLFSWRPQRCTSVGCFSGSEMSSKLNEIRGARPLPPRHRPAGRRARGSDRFSMPVNQTKKRDSH